ncbi:MAG: hypothetical protein QXN71_00320 [Candidatus Aenigmatarchaeota archaeon]
MGVIQPVILERERNFLSLKERKRVTPETRRICNPWWRIEN